jgi:hypothetical protein
MAINDVVNADGSLNIVRLGEYHDDLDKHATQLAGNSTQLAETATKAELTNAVTPIESDLLNKADISYVNQKVENIVDWKPRGVYATLSELEVAYPIGTTGIYLISGTGHAYAWNATIWTDLGEYKGNDITNRIPLTWVEGYINTSGSKIANVVYNYSDLFVLTKGTKVYINAIGSENVALLSKWNANDTFIKMSLVGNNTLGHQYEATEGIEYLRVTTQSATLENAYVEITSSREKSLVPIIESVEQFNTLTDDIRYGKEVDLTWNAGFLRLDGTIGASAAYKYSNSFTIFKGDKITIYVGGSSSTSFLSKWDANGVFVKNLITGNWIDAIGTGTTLPYRYTATEDIEYLRITNNYTYYLSPRVIVLNGSLVGLSEDIKYVEEVANGNIELLNTKIETVKVNSLVVSPQSIRKPVINFQFDDGITTDANVVSLFKSYNYFCGFALPTPINRDTEYLQYQEDGFEILSHATYGDAMSSGTTPSTEIELVMRTSKELLTARGFNIKGWVTPASELHESYMPIVKKYYEFAFTDYLGEWNTTMPENPYNTFIEDTRRLKRVSMQSSTQQSCLDAIDKVIADGGILTFYAHSYPDGTVLPQTKMVAILDHLKTKTDANKCLVLKPSDAYTHLYTLRHSDILSLLQV